MTTTTTRIAAFVLSFAAAGAAFAGGDILADAPQHAGNALSRAEVQADLNKALAAGTLRNREYQLNEAAPAPSVLSRAEVRAETLRAIASGELRALNDEQSPFARQFRSAPAKAADAQMAAVSK